jgi:hypothetical protein
MELLLQKTFSTSAASLATWKSFFHFTAELDLLNLHLRNLGSPRNSQALHVVNFSSSEIPVNTIVTSAMISTTPGRDDRCSIHTPVMTGPACCTGNCSEPGFQYSKRNRHLLPRQTHRDASSQGVVCYYRSVVPVPHSPTNAPSPPQHPSSGQISRPKMAPQSSLSSFP